MLAFQSSIQLQATQVGLGDQSSLPAISTANVLGAIIGGVLKLPIGKTLNLWGRAEAWLLFLGVYLLGIIISAAFKDTAGYSAGYTLYWIGYDALYFIADVFIADTSGLRNRALSFAFINTPFVSRNERLNFPGCTLTISDHYCIRWPPRCSVFPRPFLVAMGCWRLRYHPVRGVRTSRHPVQVLREKSEEAWFVRVQIKWAHRATVHRALLPRV